MQPRSRIQCRQDPRDVVPPHLSQLLGRNCPVKDPRRRTTRGEIMSEQYSRAPPLAFGLAVEGRNNLAFLTPSLRMISPCLEFCMIRAITKSFSTLLRESTKHSPENPRPRMNECFIYITSGQTVDSVDSRVTVKHESSVRTTVYCIVL